MLSRDQNKLKLVPKNKINKKQCNMDHNSGNYSSPWAAVLGHHHSMTSDPNFTHGLPMDLHVSQGFSYYRYNYS